MSDREQLETSRAYGLRKRHETRLRRAVRREVAAEITTALEGLAEGDMYSEEAKRAFRLAAEVAHQYGSKETP